MISESTIEQVIEQFENQTIDFETSMRQLGERQPAVLPFLLSDTEGSLTDDERDLMLYVALIIWMSVEKTHPGLPPASAEALSDAEERNLELLETSNARHFRERLDVFYENTPQEDLLAFIEDMVTSEDEDDGTFQITPEGREPVFVALKTLVDVLTEND
jgi:hypothetical protein